MSVGWNLWHGCHKKSEGCLHCYVHRRDARYGIAEGVVKKNSCFDLPLRKGKNGLYTVPSGSQIYTCFTSDFLLEEADGWRKEAWDIIRERYDCEFLFITKRIERFRINLPHDWGSGWEHVAVGCTCENQRCADERLPIFTELPIRHRYIICEPLLGSMYLSPYLSDRIDAVIVGGESGSDARVCDYEWVLDIRRQCVEKNVKFIFRQTGARLLKDNKLYNVERKIQHSQARKAGIDTF